MIRLFNSPYFKHMNMINNILVCIKINQHILHHHTTIQMNSINFNSDKFQMHK